MSETEQSRGLRKLYADLMEYWVAYGGWVEFRQSEYTILATILTPLLFPLWWAAGWWGITFDVLPSILGFSLAGYAIFLAFGDEHFRALISTKPSTRPHSPYVGLTTSFVHFIVVQVA